MSGFKIASIYSKIALLIATVDILFFIIGFGSSYWQVGEFSGQTIGYGLWSTCSELNGTITCISYGDIVGQDSSYNGNLQASRGLIATAFLCMSCGAVLNFFYIYTASLNKPAVAVILAIMAVICVVTNVVGIIIYGSTLVLPNYSLDWSIGMNVVAMIFSVSIACLLVIEVITSTKKKMKVVEEDSGVS